MLSTDCDGQKRNKEAEKDERDNCNVEKGEEGWWEEAGERSRECNKGYDLGVERGETMEKDECNICGWRETKDGDWESLSWSSLWIAWSGKKY